MSSEDGELRETAVLKFLVCPAHLVVGSGMVQRIHKFVHCFLDHEYEPYMKSKPGTKTIHM